MQFHRKLIIQTQKNGEKPLGRHFFFFLIWLRQSLDIMVSYRYVQY